MRYFGRLFYETADGERRCLAAFDVVADNEPAAQRLVLDRHWDQRLDSTDCRPVFQFDDRAEPE
jgi:hypothetical protein